jgi:hypothetical protein
MVFVSRFAGGLPAAKAAKDQPALRAVFLPIKNAGAKIFIFYIFRKESIRNHQKEDKISGG